MKTMIKQLAIICGVVAVLFLSSCDIPLSLGPRLDVEGPVVTITSPAPRKPVLSTFTVKGTVTDYTGTDILLVKIVLENEDLSRQWRYNSGKWEISDNKGVVWAEYTSENTSWTGSPQNAAWSVDINLPPGALDGEYTVVVQAWDKAGFTDDNSYKTRVVIVDRDPPKVNITDPFLYVDYSKDDKKPTDPEFTTLDGYGDDDLARYVPSNIGKFITRGFNLQYQIDDNSDVWSIEIRLYDANDPSITTIDEEPASPLPDGYIYNYIDNDLPLPVDPDPANNIKPNGTIKVPALDGSVNSPVTGKTTIMVVALCRDAADNVNQEKILGYFFYWPKADKPWIAFTEGMYAPGEYANEDAVYMVYPGRNIKATAFQAHGVTKVEYGIYKYSGWNGYREPVATRSATENNPPRFGGVHSTIFPWEFLPPSSTGFYSIVATAYGDGNVVSDEHTVMFYVQDVSFPDFPEEPSPLASLPLYQSIGVEDSFGNPTSSNSIRIHGLVSDATKIDSVYLVWINPQSRSYAAMSQLQYFRNSEYRGWTDTAGTALGNFVEEDLYDTDYPNKVWNVPIEPIGKDIETGRELYEYSQEIDITTHLNIAGSGLYDSEALKSQTFLLRAANPDRKCTIITYAPQGDESPPIITIDNVVISGSQTQNCKPGTYALIEQFKDDDVITIKGTWKEDSTGYLNFETYLKDNFEITINGTLINGTGGTTLSFDPSTGKSTEGQWTATATVGNANTFKTENLKDTLVVAALLSDIGGNVSEAGGAWLIRSDSLRLLRISSEMADTKYNAGKPISIFMEFNKPVLRANLGTNAVLRLNVTGSGIITATHRPGQTTQSTRQYFDYTIGTGHNTGTDPVLDVLGLDGISGSNYWTAANYPFTWSTGTGTEKEEIRITTESSHDGLSLTGESPNAYYTRRVPLYAHAGDNPFSLRAGKNIEIDTQAPTVTSISASTPAGDYAEGADISIDVIFNEEVKVSGTPTLTLQLSGRTVQTNGTVKVNGNRVSFSYKVANNDTTGENQLVVNTFVGTITDIAGNPLATNGISSMTPANRTLTGRYIEARPTNVPRVKILTAASNTHWSTTANVVSNTVGTAISGVSTTGMPAWGDLGPSSTIDLKNLYRSDLWLAIDGDITQGARKLGTLEYSVDNGKNWIRAPAPTNNAYVLKLDRTGSYTITARQIDRAGNISNWSQPIAFNWDNGGNLVSRIDSTTANGTYTNNGSGRTDTINVTVHFRKPLTFSGTTSITLNAIRGTGTTQVTVTDGVSGAGGSTLSFTYSIANNDNTPTGTGRAQYLDVTAMTLTATDAEGVAVSTTNTLIAIPADTANRLGYRKDIVVQTGNLTLSSGPTYVDTGTAAQIRAADSWTGTITLRFNRPISKNTGNVTITQQTTGYRLPAVLTDEQSKRYNAIANFNTYYTRGTNGFANGTSDTSTKFILNYSETAVVNPVNGGTAIQQLAYNFLQAERVILPVSSQDVKVEGDTLTITLTGSNALQVLGATYNVVFDQGFVQDNLNYRWPATTQTYPDLTTPQINRPFVRIDKRINEDRITAPTGGGTGTTPYLAAGFSRILTTSTRLDCRTPNSIVRYAAAGQEHTATQATTNYNRADIRNAPGTAPNWRNGGPLTGTLDAADTISYGTQQVLAETGTGGTNYTNFATTIDVGTNNEQGYVWRISVRSRNGANGNTNSELYEEIAFRTVLTYQLTALTGQTGVGQPLSAGDQLWIRGGDAISSSSVPGFPLTWNDDYASLTGKRAGIRLLQRVSGTALNTAVWRWISWEINVRTWHDVVLARNIDATTPSANDAWQYGPRQWAYQTGGWTALKDDYTLYPGRHRWMNLTQSDFAPGGPIKWSLQFNARSAQATSITQPNP